MKAKMKPHKLLSMLLALVMVVGMLPAMGQVAYAYSAGDIAGTTGSGASEADIIEKIDIGGISLIRAGAKNFKDVVIVPSKAEYSDLLDMLNNKGANSDIEDRRHFAERAFATSSHYDTAIHSYFAQSK